MGGGGFMTPAFDQLKAMADAHPTVFSGSWFNPANPRQLVIGVVLPHDPAAVKLEALRRELDPEQKATKTVPAKYSWAQLQQLQQMQQWVLVHYMEPSKYGIQGLGPDQIGEALHVTIYRTDRDPALDQNPAVLAIAAKYGNAVEFEETSGVGTLDLAALPAPPHRPVAPESSEMIMFVRPMSDRVGSTDAQDYGESDGGWERPAELPSRSQ